MVIFMCVKAVYIRHKINPLLRRLSVKTTLYAPDSFTYKIGAQ